MKFELNKNIEEDSIFICDLDLSELRLMKDGDVDWFILIPKRNGLKEWTDMNLQEQLLLNGEINKVTNILKNNVDCEKVNTANLGNIVSQFHLHIIARFKTDRAWPGPIWGSKAEKEFDSKRVDFWKSKFNSPSSITLRHLTLEDEEEFLKALNSKWDDDFAFAHYYESIFNKNYGDFVKGAPRFEKGELIPEGHVPASLLFAFNEKNECVGRTSIRHKLTPYLLEDGGHIGYGVPEHHRKKGYATAILKESLNYVREKLPEIKTVLVTCDEGNIGSELTIIKNGGILENVVEKPVPKSAKKRFWIYL